MSSTLTQRTNDLVNAFLDDVERVAGWRHGFLHAELLDGGARLVESLAEAFVVPADPPRECPPLIYLASAVLDALEGVYFAYRDAGSGFAQLDLTVSAPDGRYRMHVSHEPSVRLAGQRDPRARIRLDDRYAELCATIKA